MINRLGFALAFWFATGLALLVWSFPAVAAPPTKYFQAGTVYGTTAAEACANYQPKNPYGGSTALDPGNAASCQLFNPRGVPQDYVSIGFVMSCAPVYTAPNTSKPLALQCPDPPSTCPSTDKGPMDVTTAWATGSGAGAAIAKKVVPDGAFAGPFNTSTSKQWCVNSCTVTPSAGPTSCQIDKTASANGYNRISCTVPMVGVASSCDGTQLQDPVKGASAAEPAAANTGVAGGCPSGSVPAGQDPSGMTICQGKTPVATPPTNSTTTPATTATDSAGNSVKTQSTVSTNTDGSKTTTTTVVTTAPNGAVTTAVNAVTSAAPSGGSGTQDTPQDQKDMCALHPELNVCRNSQVQGSCDQVTCTGDAIQCATLRAAATMQCAMKDDKDSLSKLPATVLGNSIMSGSDPMQSQIDTALKGTTVDLSNPNLDQSGFVGASSCIADKSFTVMGRSVSVSFARVCSNIQPLRYVMLSIGFILAYLIVSKSVLRA